MDPALAAFYDRFWSSRGDRLRHRHDTHEFFRPARAWLYSRGGSLEGARCLDLGAGAGDVAAELALRGAQVVVVDGSAACVARLRQRSATEGLDAQWTVVQAEAEALPFEDGAFDLVIASKLLMHVKRDRVLPECARVLAPGGRAWFVEPMAHHPVAAAARRLSPRFRRVPCDYLRREGLARFGDYFASVRSRPFFLLSPLLFPSRRLQELDRRLLDRLPGLGRWAWVAAIEART